ncbi:MAG TPA: methylmalonyl Co-A mutase-associated GTPase MeaB [Thermoanaerobaculia bacterium]|nr:methylmalonyl Co-A mutase-associated GTPase MeaB [Thermoanaerobaculia bacterium]HUM31017.1 methylmalonyl Co-A mutase-associated GTPase MeaB [Thermoanaerobaculia bacterium]HXK69315.1 methylmalonyl Co-A mutase-associated GTPase MeaB [Thermoanaerobaculia bacterium]
MVAYSPFVARMLEGDIRSLGRVITAIENGTPDGYAYLRELYPLGGKSQVVGITGPPGAGKSTIVDCFARSLRKRGKRVGIVAVDPTSPFSGGALLGDRIRMQRLYTDPGIFIRSMATRGSTGGLAQTSLDVVDAMSAASFDVILVETIGIGQDEVDVIRAVDTVIVVLVPGLGDDIQALKAGMMEIGDIFVVNKADREGVNRTVLEIQGMLEMGGERPWIPPILQTVASRDEGMEEVLSAISTHADFLSQTSAGEERCRAQAEFRLTRSLASRFTQRYRERLASESRWDGAVEKICQREQDPHSLVDTLLKEVL